MAFVVARDWRSKGGQRELHDRECLFHPITKGSFVVAVSLEPRHQCLKSLARLVGTLALVGFLHRLEHVGVTRLGKVRAKIPEFMDLAPLDDREVPQNVDECLADAFASVQYAENRLIRSRRSCNIAVHTREFSVEPSHIPRGTFGPSNVITESYDDGLSGHLKAIQHQCRKLATPLAAETGIPRAS